jgi:hypothetical protein
MKNFQVIDAENPTNVEEIHDLERRIRNKLPKDYVEFLLLHNGGHPIRDTYKLIEPIWNDVERGSEADIAWFYALYHGEFENINKAIFTFKEFSKRIPDELIPIGRSSGGNQICLCIKGPNYGKVYFWDHNWEAEEGKEPTYDNIYLIANSFTDFINSLYEYKPSKEETVKR